MSIYDSKGERNSIKSSPGMMEVFSPGGQRIGGAFKAYDCWVVYTGNGATLQQKQTVVTASNARDALQNFYGDLLEVDES